MKKNECNIIQDLLPLVLDQAASDESRHLVEDHISSCTECAKKYDEMKAEMPATLREEYEEEQRKFVEAAAVLKSKRIKRKFTAITLSVILCLAAAFSGTFIYDYLFHQMSVAVDPALYSLSLSQLADGSLIVTADTTKINFNIMSASSSYLTGSKNILYIYLAASPIHRTYDPAEIPNRETKWCIHTFDAGALDDIIEIRQGNPDSYQTLWEQGDSMPKASEEMETYFALERQRERILNEKASSNDGKVYVDHEFMMWQDQIEQARLAVPEWQ